MYPFTAPSCSHAPLVSGVARTILRKKAFGHEIASPQPKLGMDNPVYEFGDEDAPLIDDRWARGEGGRGGEREQTTRGRAELDWREEEGAGIRGHPIPSGQTLLDGRPPRIPTRPDLLPHEDCHYCTMPPRAADTRSLDVACLESGSTGSIDSAGSGHCHDDIEHSEPNKRAERVLWIVAGLSVIFISAEAVGGILAHSLAIITDAGHLLSDLLSFIISIIAIRFARHPASKKLSFGYHRAEILGATISIVILWVLTTILVLLAIERIIENKLEIDADTMLITAGAGVIFNLIMAAVLMFGSGGHGHSHSGLSQAPGHGHSHGGGGHGHSHAANGHGHSHENGHGHSHSVASVEGGDHDHRGDESTRKNVNVRAAFVHVIGDLVQSVGVLIAALVIKFTGWAYADPICTFLFSIIVLFTTITVLRDIFYVLMEATPPHIDYASLRGDLMRVENVAAVHDLHVWSLNMEKAALSVHLAINNTDRAVETVSEARAMILKGYSVHMVTIQVEPYDKSMNECKNCQPV